MMSRRLYKKNKYYTRKEVPSYKSKTSNHIVDARRIYKISNVAPSKELASKTGCTLATLNKIVRERGRIFRRVLGRIRRHSHGE